MPRVFTPPSTRFRSANSPAMRCISPRPLWTSFSCLFTAPNESVRRLSSLPVTMSRISPSCWSLVWLRASRRMSMLSRSLSWRSLSSASWPDAPTNACPRRTMSRP